MNLYHIVQIVRAHAPLMRKRLVMLRNLGTVRTLDTARCPVLQLGFRREENDDGEGCEEAEDGGEEQGRGEDGCDGRATAVGVVWHRCYHGR